MSAEELANQEVDQLTCPVCCKSFADEHCLANHVIVHKDFAFPCKFCPRQFKRISNFKKHILYEHSEANEQKKIYYARCDDCGKSFQKRAFYEAHRNMHAGLRFKCSVCQKTFSTKYYLAAHKRTHDPDFVKQTYDCDQCEKKFTHPDTLRQHVEVKHLHQLHVCEVCGKRVTTEKSLKDHMLIHTGEKPFACGDCGKAFNTKKLLVAHSSVHTKEKRFGCKICEKRYAQRCSLSVHMKLAHNDERPFVCSICSKGFAAQSFLNMHIKSHKAVKMLD